MKYGFILVEGETEMGFVNEVLQPHLQQLGLHITPQNLGGSTHYDPVRKDLQRLLKNTHVVAVTTMIDFYRLPREFPGLKTLSKDKTAYQKVEHLENVLAENIKDGRFIPYLSIHEFEGLLFSHLDSIVAEFPDINSSKALQSLQEITSKFSSPEEINDSYETVPSRRLAKIFPSYYKPLNSPNIASRIGLPKIRETCQHFDTWLRKLEQLAQAE